jgi:hypothetical protein
MVVTRYRPLCKCSVGKLRPVHDSSDNKQKNKTCLTDVSVTLSSNVQESKRKNLIDMQIWHKKLKNIKIFRTDN